jgi:hypothetical protein
MEVPEATDSEPVVTTPTPEQPAVAPPVTEQPVTPPETPVAEPTPEPTPGPPSTVPDTKKTYFLNVTSAASTYEISLEYGNGGSVACIGEGYYEPGTRVYVEFVRPQPIDNLYARWVGAKGSIFTYMNNSVFGPEFTTAYLGPGESTGTYIIMPEFDLTVSCYYGTEADLDKQLELIGIV